MLNDYAALAAHTYSGMLFAAAASSMSESILFYVRNLKIVTLAIMIKS